MNTALSYIPLEEAIKVTGVSESTLRRFAEAGYFRSEQTDSGLTFEKNELFSLFKISNKPIAERVVSARTSDHPEIAPSHQQETKLEVEDEVIPEPETIEVTNNPHRVSSTAVLSQEIEKLKALAELHEKYISYKESEIKSLTEERDWLRTRIEKLEDKAERDQMIMASMSETQRGLLTQLDKKRSTLQLALEWVGILPQQNEK
jgi:hypothetical protein